MTSSKSATILGISLVHLMLVILAIFCLFPFAWLICATLKTDKDMFNYLLLPWGSFDNDGAHHANVSQGMSRLTTGNFSLLFSTKPFLRWLINSIFLSSLHTTIVVTLSSMGGFALAKYEFAGKKPLMLMMLATMVIPGQVLLPSNITIMHQLGWLNTYWAVLVPGAVSVFGMFLFMQAMKSVPDELLQCGRLDGCSELRLWWEVALPIVRPMIGAFTLMSFMSSWNSFLWPQIVLQDESLYTLSIGLSSLVGLPTMDTPYGMLMAGTLMSVIPVVILFFALQRDFISGLATGAVKG